jgi:hypothetical protein
MRDRRYAIGMKPVEGIVNVRYTGEQMVRWELWGTVMMIVLWHS